MEFLSGLVDSEMHVESGGGSGLRVAYRQGLSNGVGLRVRYKKTKSIRFL